MSDKATLRRLLREISDAKRTEEIIIAGEAIVKLFDAVRDEDYAENAALRAELDEANKRNGLFTSCMRRGEKLYKDAHPEFDGFPDGAENIAWLLEALSDANKDAERLPDELRREQNPGYTCAALATHEARINEARKGGE